MSFVEFVEDVVRYRIGVTGKDWVVSLPNSESAEVLFISEDDLQYSVDTFDYPNVFFPDGILEGVEVTV